MLTPKLLKIRLADWKSAVECLQPAQGVPAILLYQTLFALVHDLKSSILVSADPNINGLVPLVLAIEDQSRRLAYGEIELVPDGNGRLAKLLLALDSLESLNLLLEREASRARELPNIEAGTLEPSYPWESLSRARAGAAKRLGYRFCEVRRRSSLSELNRADEAIRGVLKAANGLPVSRRLDPIQVDRKESDLALEISWLIALPPDARIEPDWKPL